MDNFGAKVLFFLEKRAKYQNKVVILPKFERQTSSESKK